MDLRQIFETTPGVGVQGARRTPKGGWVTRRLPEGYEFDWRPVGHRPAVGDVLLCEVDQTSLHGRLETRTGDRTQLYSGDLVICALGGRYATSLLEGCAALDGAHADLLSASGVCGRVLERSDKTARATTLNVVAQAFLGSRPLNLGAFALGLTAATGREPAWIVVVGSAMDSGKTTACCSLINGLTRRGARVGAAKLTGTASSRDLRSFRDAGAEPVVDFLDCGWPSTAGCSGSELSAIADVLVGELRNSGVDVGVIEIADGVLQPETATLIEHVRDSLPLAGVVLTTRESLAAVAGVERLAARGIAVSVVSGVVTGSPLASREVELYTGVPCAHTRELGSEASLRTYFERVLQFERRAATSAR